MKNKILLSVLLLWFIATACAIIEYTRSIKSNSSFIIVETFITLVCLCYYLLLYKTVLEKREKEQEKVPEKTAPIEPPKPTTRKVVMQIHLINNKTDKEYIINSNTDFGLTWEFAGEKPATYQLLIINQKDEKGEWTSVGRFLDFSITQTKFQTFNIESSETN